MVILILALLQSAPSIESAERFERAVEREASMDHLIVASADARACAKIGYQKNEGQSGAANFAYIMKVAEEDGITVELASERFNAVVDRVNDEHDDEWARAQESRESFRYFKKSMEYRCGALIYDHPDLLLRTRTTVVAWILTWDQMERQFFGAP